MRRRALLALGLAAPAAAQPAPWPARPIRVVVAWPAGGGVDTPTRLVAGPMGRFLGQTLVLENRGGATGTIGEMEAARAAPDGYTMLADGLGIATNALTMRGLPFDPLEAFDPVAGVTRAPLLLVVRADHPARDLAGLLDMARARPGALSYFSSGQAGGPHQAGIVLLTRAGATATHVSYRGGSQSIAGVMSGDTDFGFSTLPQAVPLVQSGALRALGVSATARLPLLPAVPTVAEQGFAGFQRYEDLNFWVPRGTPAAHIARLHAATAAALAEPDVRARLAELGMEPVGSTPAQLAAEIAAYRASAAELIKAAGIKAE